MVDLAGARVVAILTRAPSAGGKTRLFAGLGRRPDPALLAALLLDTLDGVGTSGLVRAIVVEPPQACGEVRRLAPGIDVVPQAPGPLGVRMAAAMRHFFDRGASAVALVGSDLPDLRPAIIGNAFAALDVEPSVLVLGPAGDGGYYLIASKSLPPVFEGIEWGTDRVLAETRGAAERAGLRLHLLEPLDDVDVPDALARVRAPRTAAWVSRHL